MLPSARASFPRCHRSWISCQDAAAGHADDRLQIPLDRLAVLRDALEAGAVGEDRERLLQDLAGDVDLVAVGAQNPFMRSAVGRRGHSVLLEHGGCAAVAGLAHGVDDQPLQFVRPGLVPAQPEQAPQRDQRFPAGAALHAAEGERHGPQARPDAAGEGAVERPATAAAGAALPAALQKPEDQNLLDKHQDEAKNLAKCLCLEQFRQLYDQNVQGKLLFRQAELQIHANFTMVHLLLLC